MTAPVHALLLTGGVPPYVDPWHPFAESSDRLGELAEGLGWSVERADDVGARLAQGLDGIDVLLVNAPGPQGGVDPAEVAAADRALGAFLERRGGVLALHIAATALLGLPRWSALTGARWIQGVSGHPPLGDCVVHGHDDPRVPGDLELFDERYTDLGLEGDRTVLVSYDGEDGRTHPLVWATEPEGARVLVDTFGHDARSFDSPSHRELLERSLRWLAGG
jgi:uncharacterized protein